MIQEDMASEKILDYNIHQTTIFAARTVHPAWQPTEELYNSYNSVKSEASSTSASMSLQLADLDNSRTTSSVCF